MNLPTILYPDYERNLPQSGQYVVGCRRGPNIVVYQAYRDEIANWAVEHQHFGGPAFSFGRMTWIKPNFLWMMYRSGWASKEGQTRILAIEVEFEGFCLMLQKAVSSSLSEGMDPHEWRTRLDRSDIRYQWDPDHYPDGSRHTRRAIQIGIKGGVMQTFIEKWISGIEDITDFVKNQRERLPTGNLDLKVIEESVIKLPNEVIASIGADTIFPNVQN